jgi:hypothetical protein
MSKKQQFWDLSSQRNLAKRMLIVVPAVAIICNIAADIFENSLRGWGVIAVLVYTMWIVVPAYCIEVFLSIGAFRENSRSTFIAGNIAGALALLVELVIMVSVL